MLLSLKTPKRRAVTGSGVIFYNNFSSALLADAGGEQLPVALHTGAGSWTVSGAGEAVLLINGARGQEVVIIDPIKRTRLFQKSQRFETLDLLLTRDRFAAAVPGLLLAGKRADNGGLDWSGARAIDRGAGYLFGADGDGTLCFTKRGSCRRYRYDFDGGGVRSEPDNELMWKTLFKDAVTPPVSPALPAEYDFSPASLPEQFRSAVRGGAVSDAGIRLLALFQLMDRRGAGGFDLLENLIALDFELQYSNLLNGPFPSLPLMQRLLDSDAPFELRPGRLLDRKLLRWSRKFESAASSPVQVKTIGDELYSDQII